MISQLHIENIAVIENMDILFQNGLNLLTGETGAGKSIVIDALGAILGGRTSRDLIRTGASGARVSAVFWKPDGMVGKWLLDTLGMGLEDDELHVAREILSDGRTVCRVGGRPVTVTQLRELGALLVQVHGQHDSQILLDENRHLSFLDAFGQCEGLLAVYQECFDKWRAVCAERDALLRESGDKARRIDLLRYQLDEIECAALREGEDVHLKERRSFLKNAAKVSSAVEESYALLYGDDNCAGVHDLLSQASNSLSAVSDVSAELSELCRRVDDLMYAADDIADEVRRLRDELDADPHELEQIETRLDQIYRLKKYGATAAEIIAFGQALQTELDGIEHSEERLAEVESICKAKELDLTNAAKSLSDKRSKAAPKLCERLRKELCELDMEKVRLTVEVSTCYFGPKGADSVRFLISTNPGEPPKPLSKVASGGELARVMLALMNVLAGNVDTMVFDEVDTGISGRAAQRVAEKLGRLSGDRQILCVTHLPQIAAMADHHFHIEKEVVDGRTVTKINALDEKARVAEIARIIGGASITGVTMKSAAELIESARKIKMRRV